MYIEFSSRFDELIDDELNDYSNFFESMATSHRLGYHIILPSLKLLLRINLLDGISDAARATFNLISRRINDYRAAAERCRRVIVICPTCELQNIVFSGRKALVSSRLLTEEHLMTQKFFLAENIRDVMYLRALLDILYSSEGFPSSYVHFRPLAGGGSTIADVLESETATPHKGYIICDRDTSANPPPYRQGTTAHLAFERAVRLGALGNSIGLSECNPFFAFDNTQGRCVENYLGPHLLDLYFNTLARRTERRPFSSAFPNFPNLSEDEMTIWMLLNLKDGTPVMTETLDQIRTRFGGMPPWVVSRTRSLSALSVPRDAISWVSANAVGSRYAPDISRAVLRDLRSGEYRIGLDRHAALLREIAAGDRDARRS